MQPVPDNIKVKSLYKAIHLLDQFTDEHPTRGVSELAELTGMLKSTVHNVMNTFEQCGFVQKDPESNRYKLGLKLLELGYHAARANSHGQSIHEQLQALADRAGETAFMAQVYGYRIMYRDVAYPSSQPNSQQYLGGWTAFMHCSAMGKVLLAHQSREFVIQMAESEGLPGFTESTITNLDALFQELELVRAQGYSLDNMEQEYGFKCVACPVYGLNGQAMAAISLNGPSLRFQEEDIVRYAQLLQATASTMRFHL